MKWKTEVTSITAGDTKGAVQVYPDDTAYWAVYVKNKQAYIGDKALRGHAKTEAEAQKECEDAVYAVGDIGGNSGGFDVEF